jgi:transcriptional regulator
MTGAGSRALWQDWGNPAGFRDRQGGNVRRRDLVAGLAFSGIRLEAQQRKPESIYIPRPQLVEDRSLLQDFMDEFAFADLVTCATEIRITHIPVMLDRTSGEYGTLRGHLSRRNPQTAAFDGREPAVVVFRGPHSYISPTWFGKGESVPTWNFAVVHASGRLNAVTDQKALHDLLARLIKKFENYDSAYDFSSLPDAYKSRLMGGITGFEMQIERLEGKFKLGQDGSEADRETLLGHLRTAKPERSMHEFTAAFYKRAKNTRG